MTSSPDIISFEHFDPRFELGALDNNGKPIRIRKKPGRKPNPPSPAQRKAQNRAAQRAFRERKRCEMKQAETAVKQAIGETQRLKMELEETRYENNCLKGSLLILKLACIANSVDVPNLSWENSTASSDSIDSSKSKVLPQAMGIFLDKHKNIINLPQGVGSTSPTVLSPSSPMTAPLSPDSFVCSSPSSMVDLHQQETCPLLSSSPGSSYSGSSGSDSVQDIPPTITNPSQCLSLGPNHSLTLKLSNIDNNSGIAGPAPLSTIDNRSDILVDYDHVTEPLDKTMLNFDKWMDATISLQQSTPMIDPKTGLERLRTIALDEENTHFGLSSPLSLLSSQLKSAPPMNTMEALQYTRTIKNLDNETRSLFKPTGIQLVIPHDTRIDQVPCPMMRDLMILYQDFYDANELFDLLMGSAMFLGGDLENFDDWMMPPAFLCKFWFLCPSQRLKQLENLVEMGQRMMTMMMERKTIYLGNGQRPGDPHFTERMLQTQHHQQHSQLYDQCQEPTHEMDMMAFDAFPKDDYSLDAMMTFVDDSDILASV